jgi:hypothetical protein
VKASFIPLKSIKGLSANIILTKQSLNTPWFFANNNLKKLKLELLTLTQN